MASLSNVWKCRILSKNISSIEAQPFDSIQFESILLNSDLFSYHAEGESSITQVRSLNGTFLLHWIQNKNRK